MSNLCRRRSPPSFSVLLQVLVDELRLVSTSEPSFLHSGRTETHALGDVVSLCSGGSVLESRLGTRDGRSCVAVYAPVWWGTRFCV